MKGKNDRPRRDFELRVLPRGEREYGLALLQTPVGEENGKGKEELVVRIWGDPLWSVLDQVQRAVKRGGYRSIDLGCYRRAPFHLAEEDAVRLGLLFLALKPLRKHRRIEEVAARIRAMEPEEVYYWFSKATSSEDGRRARRALRILMSEE